MATNSIHIHNIRKIQSRVRINGSKNDMLQFTDINII